MAYGNERVVQCCNDQFDGFKNFGKHYLPGPITCMIDSRYNELIQQFIGLKNN
jgi:hypothetical protein